MKDRYCDACQNLCLDGGLPSGVRIKVNKHKKITMCVECWSFFVDQVNGDVLGSLIESL